MVGRRPGPLLAFVRLLIVPLTVVAVATADFPQGFAPWAWATVGAFAVFAVLLAISSRVRLSPATRRVLRVAAIIGDGAVAIAFAYVFAFQGSQPLRILYLAPVIEAALRFGLRGGLVSTALVTPFVVGQDLFHAHHTGDETSWLGVAVRCIVAGLAGAVVGQLRDELERQRSRAEGRAQEAEELRDRLRERVGVLEAANRCAAALASTLDLEGAFHAFLRELRPIVPFDRASVLLEDGDQARVLIATGVGGDHVFTSGHTWPLERSVLSELRRTGRTVYREDFSDAVFAEEEALLRVGLRARVVAPLHAGADLIGGLALVRREPRSFRSEEVELLTLLSRLVTNAVQNIRAYEAERRTADELRRLSALRADFVSLVSHELRSPMAAVIGAAKTLQQRWRELQPEHREAFLALIADETERLANLIGDVLDTSRIEAGTFSYTFTDVDVGALVEDAVATAAVGQDEVRIRANVDGDLPAVRGDRDRLRQVIGNLIDNAVKYSAAGDEVEVRVRAADSTVLVTVRDHGPGVPHEQRGVIFEKFGRASGDAGKPGTGLGLFIARSIAEAHGGDVELEAAAGRRGATFTLTLPTGATSARAAD